jgi:proton-dependent oligopeptide transporter, POT family
MSDTPPTSSESRGFLGQPAGFSTLFFTELWERFSYYGMRALLVLFLVDQVARGGLGLDDKAATAIYGLYTAGVYIMSMPGGWIADRLLGAQRTVLWGGIFITIGHVLLAIGGAGAGNVFLLGLAIIVLGTGLLKPNISALVGQLHAGSRGGARDAAFTWFYMAINIGAMAGPIVTAWLAQRYGWHVGFLAAAIGMGAGLAYYLRTRAQLGDTGLHPPAATGANAAARMARDWNILRGTLAALAVLVLLLWTGVVKLSPITLQGGAMYAMVVVTAVYFAYLLLLAGLNAQEKRNVIVLLVLVAASTLFWAGYEQAGSSLTLFAERHTNRLIGSYEFPAGWFQSVPAVFVLLLAPVLASLWMYLGKRGRDFSVFSKFAFGLLGMGLGFLVMVGASEVIRHSMMGASGGAGPMWLVLTYALHTIGELCLSPVGMSATTQLAPKRFAGQAMGIWFTSLAMGNLLASQLAGSLDGVDAKGLTDYFLRMFEYGAIGAVVLLIVALWLKRWQPPKS